MNINKTIHEAMGLCWHVVSKDKKVFDDIYGRFNIRYCVKCDQSWNNCIDVSDPEYERGPDYTAPVHYYALFKWMRNDDRWRVFGNWLMREHGDSQFRFLMKVEEHQIHHIAEAIEAGVLK